VKKVNIQVLSSSIFDSTCEALVNPINSEGISGRGLALEFRKRFPDAWEGLCKAAPISPGQVFIFDKRDELSNPTCVSGRLASRYIIHFPTKIHWSNRSNLDLIAAGLVSTSVEVRERNIKSIAFPALGCGLGNLRWEDVLPTIQQEVMRWKDVRVEIYEPQPDGTP
jgi:O-acetyl-ADP-ribose deacetylase (regulator of RNase III)